MSLLDHPDAQVLLADATLPPGLSAGCQDRLDRPSCNATFPRFYRVEHRTHAGTVLHGLLSGLERKTCRADRPPKPGSAPQDPSTNS